VVTAACTYTLGMMIFRRVVPALFVLVSLASGALADSDRWYILKMMGQACGDMHSVIKTEDGKVTTSSKTTISIGRGDAVAKITMESLFVETVDGTPVMMKSVQNTGGKPITSTYTFQQDGSIELVTEQNGKPITKQLPKPEGVWLTPNAADQFVRQRMKSGAKEITLRSVTPEMGATPVTVKYTDFEKTSVVVDGRTVEATKRKITTDTGQGVFKSTDYVDEDGELIKSRMSVGGINIDVIASTRAEAQAGAKTKAAPPEIMVSTFCKPDRPIENPREVTRAVLTLSVEEDMPKLPETGAQKVAADGNRATLTISTTSLSPAPEADATDPALLAATTLANSQDPEVAKLATRAIASLNNGEDTPAAKAEACRRFVHRYISKKNLGTAFATASEVARSKQGDCTEHGVLLTALLRSNGIRSRAVVGLVYADQFAGSQGIFGYHMWTQALLEVDGKHRWVDLDATLDDSTPFDATHIALDVTKLEDGAPASGLGAVAPLLGALKIKVESVEHAAAGVGAGAGGK